MSFDLKKYLAEGRLFEEPGFDKDKWIYLTQDEKEEYNFEDSDFNSMSEEEIIKNILAYFKYERDERPADMNDPSWWDGNPPFDGMSDEQILEIIEGYMNDLFFQSPVVQENYDTPADLAWEIYCRLNRF